jgi:hypothetical protein
MEGIAAGICVGCLIGILTGMMTLLILTDAVAPRSKEISHVEKVFGRRRASGIRIAAKLSIVTPHWFGGAWLTASVMNGLNWEEMRLPYLAALLMIYALIIFAPLARLIVRSGGNKK